MVGASRDEGAWALNRRGVLSATTAVAIVSTSETQNSVQFPGVPGDLMSIGTQMMRVNNPSIVASSWAASLGSTPKSNPSPAARWQAPVK